LQLSVLRNFCCGKGGEGMESWSEEQVFSWIYEKFGEEIAKKFKGTLYFSWSMDVRASNQLLTALKMSTAC